MNNLFKLALLPILLGVAMSSIYFLPSRTEMPLSSLDPNLPIDMELPGWYGVKKQESELERKTLAPDTKFSKADYFNLSLISQDKKKADLLRSHVSIVLSGEDMNSSIHRPELCLPSQGHFNLTMDTKTVTLNNGKELKLTQLNTQVNRSADPKVPLIINTINYYVFVGNGVITHNHLLRVLYDMERRVLKGQDQQWAYIQVGVNYGNTIGTSREEADEQAISLIKELFPRVIKWDEID